ncbi:hypothetical protein B0H14DRAFT_2840951 [Mycena olivaceomarginata]|nr:hypothetical protein B0H14DRAFT_2840951 [Mycena olivaceomarginata]
MWLLWARHSSALYLNWFHYKKHLLSSIPRFSAGLLIVQEPVSSGAGVDLTETAARASRAAQRMSREVSCIVI